MLKANERRKRHQRKALQPMTPSPDVYETDTASEKKGYELKRHKTKFNSGLQIGHKV